MIDDAVLAALNHLLNQADWARQRLAPFAGRHARVSMPPWHLSFRITEDGWFGAASEDAMADVVIALPADAPFLAAQGIEKAVQAARVEGGAQFAGELTYVLKNLRWDYEEDMSRLVGDIAAHRIAGGLAAFVEWQKRTAGRLTQDFVSCATEKNRLLARRTDQQGLADELAELHSAIERDERRVLRLATLSAPGKR